MKLKISTIQAVVMALTQLDPPNGKSAYKLGGKTRYNIGRSLAKLQAELSTADELRQKMIVEYGLKVVATPDGRGRLEGDRYGEYEREFQKILDQEVEVTLRQITEADLDLDNNPIPVTVLAPLDGVLIKAE